MSNAGRYFHRAIAAGNAADAWSAARTLHADNLGRPLHLQDALALTLVVGHTANYPRAADRLGGRLAAEVPVGPDAGQLAIAALRLLPRLPEPAGTALASLLEAHGQTEPAAIVDDWMGRRGAETV